MVYLNTLKDKKRKKEVEMPPFFVFRGLFVLFKVDFDWDFSA